MKVCNGQHSLSTWGWEQRKLLGRGSLDLSIDRSLFLKNYLSHQASQVALVVKSLPAMQETWVWSLGWEDPPEKGMETHSSILAWRIPWTEEPGGLQPMGSQTVRHDLVAKHTQRRAQTVWSTILAVLRKSFVLLRTQRSTFEQSSKLSLPHYCPFPAPWNQITGAGSQGACPSPAPPIGNHSAHLSRKTSPQFFLPKFPSFDCILR